MISFLSLTLLIIATLSILGPKLLLCYIYFSKYNEHIQKDEYFSNIIA